MILLYNTTTAKLQDGAAATDKSDVGAGPAKMLAGGQLKLTDAF
jgi:hypothetical protein